MSDLPRDVRAELAQQFSPLGTRIERHLIATDETHKLLLRLHPPPFRSPSRRHQKPPSTGAATAALPAM